jgi:hypothetical protein
MPDTDGVLAAIDACLDDYTLSDDAMRWAPEEPDPTPQSIPRGEQIARFVEENTAHSWTDWQRHYLNALTPAVEVAARESERCPACSCLVTDHPWEGGAQGGYVCSRSLSEPPSCRRCRSREERRVMTEMPPLWDLARGWPTPDLPLTSGAYWAATTADGWTDRPSWQPLGGDIVSDVTFARDEHHGWAERLIGPPREVHVTFSADTSHFRRVLLNGLRTAFGMRFDRQDRMRAIKSEYHRRQRRRNRR